MSIVYLVDADGIHQYSGHDSNAKVARLEAQGFTRVPLAPPEDKTQRKWNGVDWVEIEAEVIKTAILKLEGEITSRRIREAFADPTWINAQEAKIAVERAKL